MSRHSTHENREIPGTPVQRATGGRTEGEGTSLTAFMHVPGKSDIGVVPMKLSNKSAPTVDAEMAEGRPVTKGNPIQPTATGTQSPGQASSGLNRVRERARQEKGQQFTTLMHHITPGMLEEAYLALKRQAAPGVDGVRWDDYGENLKERIASLHEQVHSGRYRAQPSKRTWIPKADGRKRPLGIAALEDKIVQTAVTWVLNAIYEEDFAGFSYGFRPGRGQHHAGRGLGGNQQPTGELDPGRGYPELLRHTRP